MNAKEVIKSKGFTLQQIANKLGKTKGAIANVLNAENPNTKPLKEIAEVIGCKVGDFFTDEMTSDPKGEFTTHCPHCGKPITIKVSE